MSRERIETIMYNVLVAALVAFPVGFVVMIALGMWHGISPKTPAPGYWLCYLAVVVWQAIMWLLRTSLDVLYRPSTRRERP